MTGEEIIRFIKENHLEEYSIMIDHRYVPSNYTSVTEFEINEERKELVIG